MNVLDKLLFNLSTISNIPPGRRISTAKEFIVIDEESALQPVLRWMAADSRLKAAAAINSCVMTVIYISNLMMESTKIDTDKSAQLALIKRIGVALADAGSGVENLQQTYSADANMLAHLAPISEAITQQVILINRMLQSHGLTGDQSNVLGVRSVVMDL